MICSFFLVRDRKGGGTSVKEEARGLLLLLKFEVGLQMNRTRNLEREDTTLADIHINVITFMAVSIRAYIGNMII